MSTNENERLYLFDRLDTGQHLHIVFMSHNAYWAEAEKLSDRYRNCKVQVFGKRIAYIEMAKYSKWYEPIDDCDLIILRATNYEENEFNRMKELAHEISKEKNKPVTIGYSYINSNYKGFAFNDEFIVKVVKINNEDEIESSIVNLNMHPFDLINAALIMHDKQDKEKVKKKENK